MIHVRHIILLALCCVTELLLAQPHWQWTGGPIDSSGVGYYFDYRGPGLIFTCMPDGTLLLTRDYSLRRSTNRGVDWTSVPQTWVYTPWTICASRGGMIMLGVTTGFGDPIGGGRPFYYSSDRGVTWNRSTADPFIAPGMTVTFDSLGFLTVSSYHSQYMQDPGMVRSTDGGITWENADTTPRQCLSLYSDGHQVYAGQQGLISASDDGGLSWKSFPISRHNFSWIAATSIGTALSVTDSNLAFSSADSGNHWTNLEMPTTGAVHGLVSTFTHRFVLATDSGLFVSDSAVTSWRRVLTPYSRFSMAYAGLNNSVYAINLGRLFESTDGGETWAKFPTLVFPVAPVISMAEDSSGAVFAGADRTGVYVGPESGGWRHTSYQTDALTISCLLVTHTNTLLASGAGYDWGLCSSSDGAMSWSSVAFQKQENIETLARDSAGNLYASPNSESRLYRSGDNGGTWDLLMRRAGMSQTSPILVRLNGDILLGRFANVPPPSFALFRSRDHCATFDSTRFSTPVKGIVECRSGLYAYFDSSVARSTDDGSTWQHWNRGTLDSTPFKLLVEDTRGTLIAALRNDSVVLSRDDGATWIGVQDSAGRRPINNLFVAKSGKVLAGTTNGIYVLIDSIETSVKWETLPLTVESLEISPSPVFDVATVHWNEGRASNASVTLIDMLGREMWIEPVAASGSSRVTLTMRSLPSGWYTAAMKLGEKLLMKRFVHFR